MRRTSSTSSSDLPNPAAYASISEALLAAPADRPFATMWNDEDDIKTVTFGDFRSGASGYAAFLVEQGAKAGDRIVLVMPHGITLMACFAGTMLLGAVPAILAYPNFKVDPTKYRTGLAGVTHNLQPCMVVLDVDFPEELETHVRREPGTRVVRLGPPGGAPVPDTLAHPDNLAFIQHSAGTTGLQKGVALTHAGVLRQLDHLATALRVSPEDRVYSWLPLYHDMGLIACFVMPMVCHLPVVMQSPTNWVMQPATMPELISQYGCTLAWVPNFALQFVARRTPAEDLPALDLSSLRVLVNCSEPVRAKSIDEFTGTFAACGLRADVVQTSYAMAENVFAVTHSVVGDGSTPVRTWVDAESLRDRHAVVTVSPDTPGAVSFVSSGRCLPSNRLRVVHHDGADVEPGSVGQLLVRSDSLFNGYFGRDDLTAQAFMDGWYRTGDLGFVLDDEVYVMGRHKDLIIQGGKNIYPQDIEEIASEHPAVLDGRAVAFGIFNADLGTEDIILVAEVRSEMAQEKAAIVRALKSAIVAELGVAAKAIYLKPDRWIVKSTAGKPARAETRSKLLREHPELATEQPVDFTDHG